MATLNARLQRERGITLAVRVGIHTGPVVIGEIGGASRREELALGETPNVAARLQAIAEPDTVVISAATHRLLRGSVMVTDLGAQVVKGLPAPLRAYRARGDGGSRIHWTLRRRVAGRIGEGLIARAEHRCARRGGIAALEADGAT